MPPNLFFFVRVFFSQLVARQICSYYIPSDCSGFFYFGRLLRLLVIARAAPCFDWLCFSVFFGADRVEALPSVIFFGTLHIKFGGNRLGKLRRGFEGRASSDKSV